MYTQQRGVALVVSLVMLLLLTIISIASMNSSQMNERMAGNQRQMAEAFFAAETGLVAAKLECDAGNCPTTVTDDFKRNNVDIEWVANIIPAGDGDHCEPPAQFQIESTGRVVATNVERVLLICYSPADPVLSRTAAINIIGTIGSFDTANSNALKVYGRGDGEGGYIGPAIATTRMDAQRQTVSDGTGGCKEVVPEKSNYDIIVEDIEAKGRMDNYHGGIAEVDFDTPFGNPEALMGFISQIKQTVIDNPSIAGSAPDNMGSEGALKITVVQGNLELKGNNSGAGILLVEGNLSFSGTPNFDGLIIVTGQSFNVSGGGKGGNLGGSVVFANPVIGCDEQWQFGNAEANFEFDVDGGGTSTYRYDEGALVAARELLNEQAKAMWNPVESVDNEVVEGQGRSSLSSWSYH
ncbi:pilus assembly PilX N-terminal domain-containing protein [Ectothiorhodospira lacustris]|uniref:pilus assembly PilX N-terminal domain-containing protein n=1 Tax=Ectothiorhodospira lacustris TaxID=2899127 RepID=UPI001EE85E44|nr:PilX N-terminal domain-containing pilus assembly protein [Ectothiorhodospira lacustris]MCG5509820.1 pilus assembly PilX N-terminal domain-containing protein [Ectothiorhodospira lacustris]MCG5521073.1 pilus assembly PilX N-terminal domain-containing protein [Ectothiorhodospira lacustris]